MPIEIIEGTCLREVMVSSKVMGFGGKGGMIVSLLLASFSSLTVRSHRSGRQVLFQISSHQLAEVLRRIVAFVNPVRPIGVCHLTPVVRAAIMELVGYR
jgi:hypothetical protein